MWQMGCKLVVGSIPSGRVSDVLHDVKDPRESSTGAMAGDAAIGAAGGALMTEVFWRRQLGRHCRWSRCWRDCGQCHRLSEWW